MTPNYLGVNTVLVLANLDARGPMTPHQMASATGLQYGAVRQALRRCALRGFAAVDNTERTPVYRSVKGWRVYLAVNENPARPGRPQKPRKAKAHTPTTNAVNSVFALGAA